MTTLYESFLKGPETIMTLTSDHDYPKILKDMMKHIHLEGDAVYKGYPFVENGVELWYVEVHLHHVKGVCPKTMGQYFFISRVPRATFFDAVREAAMEAIRQIGEILEARFRFREISSGDPSRRPAGGDFGVGGLLHHHHRPSNDS